MACMLWEDTFYEDGASVADRIAGLVPKVEPTSVAAIAIDAREKMKLRHAPLLLVREMARHNTHKALVADTLERVIQRADELSEFVSIYWKDGKQPLAASVKKGLARAFNKFDEYALAKYNRDGAVKLRDVLFLCHAKADTPERDALYKRLINGELKTPDTWEVELSKGRGENKRASWERLLDENKLGALALLRNLRNMREEGVDESKIFAALERANVERVLPFRFIAAARHAPQWEHKIEPIMLKSIEGREKFEGKTVLLVDVSGSMIGSISSKSDLTRLDAACGLAVLAREMCGDIAIHVFHNEINLVPPRRGFALRDAITAHFGGATYLGAAIKWLHNNETFDRLIVLTDEQSHDKVPQPLKGKPSYMINVASSRNGVGYGAWRHIDGWSEAVFDYIREAERAD